MSMFRRLRGIATTAIVWGLGWTAVAWPVFIVLLPKLNLGPRLLIALRMAAYAGLAGAVVGGSFAVLITVLERRSTLGSLLPRRVGLWGAVAGAAYCVGLILRGPAGIHEAFAVVATAGVTGAILGGASGLLTLLLAREATRGSRPVPETSA